MKLWLKNVGLFFASPFIALGYIIALPFFGLYMFINLFVEASLKKASEVDVKVKQKV
jgi:hypothetical protein